MSVDGANYMSHEVNQPLPLDFSKLRIGLRRSRGNKLFMGEAPPSRVLEVLTRLQAVGYSPKPTDRNPLYVLLSLRLISSTVKPLLIEKPPKGAETAWLASKVVAQHSVRVARDLIRNDQYVGALEIGEALESLAHRGVSEASKRRYGSGVLVWVNWLHDLTTGESISPL